MVLMIDYIAMASVASGFQGLSSTWPIATQSSSAAGLYDTTTDFAGTMPDRVGDAKHKCVVGLEILMSRWMRIGRVMIQRYSNTMLRNVSITTAARVETCFVTERRLMKAKTKKSKFMYDIGVFVVSSWKPAVHG